LLENEGKQEIDFKSVRKTDSTDSKSSILEKRTRRQSFVQTDFPLPEHFKSKQASIFQKDDGGLRSIILDKPEKEFYFIGIIDILMLYTTRKK